MSFKDVPIQRKLITVNLLTSGIVLLITSAAFFAYEYYTFRKTTIGQMISLGRIIAANSSAALAFDDQEAANEMLATIRTEPNIVAVVLYDSAGDIFAQYPGNFTEDVLRVKTKATEYQFTDTHLDGYQPVIHREKRLGTLYLKSDLKAMDARFRLYGLITLGVLAVAFLLAFLLSNLFQKTISEPILALAATARAISDRQDYSVRVSRHGRDELGTLTDAFNHMLRQIQEKSQALREFNRNLEQKVVERTTELEAAIKVQREAQRETYEANKELSQALEELQSTQEQLIELNNELEQRVQNRTKELLASEAALKEKNKELEKTNIDLDNFIYTASHDLKSPIVNLEGLAQLMRKKLDGTAGTGQIQLLNMVDISVFKLKKTISDLAEITKVQKDLAEEVIKLSFDEILEDVKDDIRLNMEASGATLKVSLEVQQIEYPRNNLRSILYNLLSNAIKYCSPDRPPEISIRTYKEGEQVVLSVEDNGLGLNETQQARLFTMFKRFHAHVEGTGIGLYIIKRVVENRGGSIQVISKPGQGSTFKIYFSKPPES